MKANHFDSLSHTRTVATHLPKGGLGHPDAVDSILSDLLEPDEAVFRVTFGQVYSLGDGPGAAHSVVVIVTDSRLLLVLPLGGSSNYFARHEVTLDSITWVRVSEFAARSHVHVKQLECDWWIADDSDDPQALCNLIKLVKYQHAVA